MARIKPILFFTNSELGQASVVLAAAAELHNVDSSLDIHIASFPSLSKAIPPGLNFHTIPGHSMKEVLATKGFDFLPRHAPGINGAIQSYREALPLVLAPWDADQYMPIYHHCCELIQDIDPGVVVLDPLFGPGADACQVLRKQQIVLSPSTFKDHVGHLQPRLESVWKYSVMSSGFPSPMPLRSIPTNIYLIYKLFRLGYFTSSVADLQKARNEAGILGNLTTKFTNFRTDVEYLVPSTPATDYPLETPPNITGCGPIIPPFNSLSNTDPELAEWLCARPTLVVNMGSHVTYDAQQFREVKAALRTCLRLRPDMQVLWKCQTVSPPLADDGDEEDIAARIRILAWLPATPVAILAASPSILAYVHHGGSNSFHEAVAAGVPQVVCPVWLDTYDFASRAEFLGIGVWGNETAAPEVQRDELAAALARVVSRDGEGEAMRVRARVLAHDVGGADTGRNVAARLILDAALKGDQGKGLESWNNAALRKKMQRLS